MQDFGISVREIEEEDIHFIADYWLLSEDDHLTRMGVDLAKKPNREGITTMLKGQIAQAYQDKNSFALIWEINHLAVGHCNVNDIQYGDHAFMHLHLWNNAQRKQGMGLALLQKTLPLFFAKLRLQKIYCEPYALNPAPNKILPKAGFTFIKKYQTIPGPLCFMQDVNQWMITKEEVENRGLIK